MQINRKKIVILVVTIALTFLSIGIGVYAYFRATSTKDSGATTDITNETIIEIASFDDLFDYSKDSAFNDVNVVSNSSNRKILKLTEDIYLTMNLIITADVHLNLNGKILNLNDYELTIKHGYAGCFNIYNGTIQLGTNGNGKITLDLPSASLVTSGMEYKSGSEIIEETDCINVLKIDAKYTAYTALYLVSNNIASDLEKRVELKDYNTVQNDSFLITQDKFITSKPCSYNNDSDVCSYVYKDLDLINHYLSSDVTIEYESSNEAIVSNDGKVNLPTTEEDVTLTVKVNHDSWDNYLSCIFKLHVVNLSNELVKNKVAKDLVKSYLIDYYHDNDLRINDTIVLTDYYYGFNHGVTLPLSAMGGNITYSYKLMNLSNAIVTTTSHVEGDSFVLEPNSDCFKLVITYNESIDESLNMYSSYAGDRETIARLILNKLYGGAIIYDSSNQNKELFDLSALLTELDATTYAYVTAYNITGLSYQLKTDTEAATYYTYSNNLLAVAEGQVPPAKTSYITATFTFGSDDSKQSVSVDLYIDYLAESGDTISGFMSYYNLYDPQVVSYMTTTFEMPFCFGTGAPYICYDFSNSFTKTTSIIESEEITYYSYTYGMPDSLKVVLYYNKAERLTFSNYSSGESLTSQLNEYLNSNNLTLSQIGSYGDAKYLFKIDAQNATVDSVKMLLLYNYKFNSASENWSLYKYHLGDDDYITELTATEFTVDGGLFYNESSSKVNAVQDKYFFAWIYNSFNPDTSATNITYSSVKGTSFIPKSWLSLDVALDKTQDSTLASVTNYAGIGNLTKITKVNLSGITLSSSVLSSIASMTSVTNLNLSNCGITTISSICTMNSVKVLDLSKNSIDDFNDLVNLRNLEEVYVYDNNATHDNPIVGSFGITNLQAYNDLLRKGVAVFNQVSGDVPVIYADSDDYNDYVKIKSIIFQNKLSKNVQISTLYSAISGDISSTSLSLQNTNGRFYWGYQQSDSDGNTYTEYTATYFYVNYTFNNKTVNVKFYVDRY